MSKDTENDVIVNKAPDDPQENTSNGLEVLAAAVGSAAKGTAKTVRFVGKGVSGTAAAVSKTVGTVSGIINKTFGDAETRHYKKEKKYLSKRIGKKFLIIQKDSKTADHFTVYTTDEEIKYLASGKKSPSSVNVVITGADGREAASVGPIEGKTRYSVFRKRNIPELLIRTGSTEFSVFSEQLTEKKEPDKIDPAGWIVKEISLGSSYSVYSGSTEIMHLEKRSGYGWPTFILDHGDPKKELICLSIALTIMQLKTRR